MKCIDFDLKINKVHAALVRAQCFLRKSEAHALHQLSNSSGMLLVFFYLPGYQVTERKFFKSIQLCQCLCSVQIYVNPTFPMTQL